MRIFCLCAFRNAADVLPDFLDHLRGHVDGVILLDDGSTDDGYKICEAHPTVTGLITDKQVVEHAPHARETENRELLLREAYKRGADWVLCMDADERVEKNMLREMRALLDKVPQCGAVSVKVCDLWNDLGHYRTDARWAGKRKEILFWIQPFSSYWPKGSLHCRWRPPEIHAPVFDSFYNLYHLGSLTKELRAARVEKFLEIDSNPPRFQEDYNYLADETGLKLEKIPEGRGWK